MQNTILQTAKYCFSGFNQFLICETKAQAKAYLKQNSSINRIKDLVTITEELRATMLKGFAECIHVVYNITSGYAVPLENDTRSDDDEIREQLRNDDDSAENAGDDKQWYRERAQNFEFHPFTLTCDMCLESDAYYIGVTKYGTPFGFCKICRDELQALKIERTQSPERFGI